MTYTVLSGTLNSSIPYHTWVKRTYPMYTVLPFAQFYPSFTQLPRVKLFGGFTHQSWWLSS